MRLHLFNPENDLALADNSPNYTAPAGARRLGIAGSMLPAWFAVPGDLIYAEPNEVNFNWLHRMQADFNLSGNIMSDTDDLSGVIPQPWGWSHAVARRFETLGVKQIPDYGQIETMRDLSHRKTSIEINRQLAERGFNTPPLPVIITDSRQYVPGGAVIAKSPWSGSGRGIIDSTTMSDDYFRWQLAGIIHRQQSVLIEQRLNKMVDFAMLFYAGRGGVRYCGLSLFNSNEHGQYTGNIVACNNILMQRLCSLAGCDEDAIMSLAATLCDILEPMLTDRYTGNLGVDMMVYLDNNNRRLIAPCIELNLRNTMGHIALSLGNSIISEGSIGNMSITPRLKKVSGNKSRFKPAVIKSGQLVAGTIKLVPDNDYFDIALTNSPSR